MALIILIDEISEALENGVCVIGIFRDFSKAFDTVDHIILLQKLYFLRHTGYYAIMVWKLFVQQETECNI